MLSMLGRIGHFIAPSGLLHVIYAGPDRSFYYAIRAFKFDQLDVIHARQNRSFYYVIRAFKFNQLDVIYAGSYRSFL